MKKFTIVYLLIISIGVSICQAQNHPNKLISRVNLSDITNYVSKGFKLKDKIIDTLCLYTTVFVKFSVGKHGSISNISYTSKTPEYIKGSLDSALRTSNGHWSTRASDQVFFSKKIFVLPVILYYGIGCTKGSGELDTITTKTNLVNEYNKIDNTLRNSNNAIRDILSIGNNRSPNTLECIIISPISLGANKN